jgi:type II secretory ATPase GspE/PulE/Tfp pilus assembly ATPase PilB-like protein
MNKETELHPEENSDQKNIHHRHRVKKKSKFYVTFNSFTFNREYPVPEELLKNLRYEYLRRELWVPLELRGGKIAVIVDNPDDIIKRDMIENILKTKSVEYISATKEDIGKFIEYFYDVGEQEEDYCSADVNGEIKNDIQQAVSKADVSVVKLVNDAINEAFDKRASDIHIEPDTKDKLVNVRFRIDGECINYRTLPYEYRAGIVSRIKIMANLDITEKRLPQDGKIKYKVPGAEEIELRVATLPTHGYVEDVVLRLLTRGKIMTLDELYIPADAHNSFQAQMKKPYGLILLVGPTGGRERQPPPMQRFS